MTDPDLIAHLDRQYQLDREAAERNRVALEVALERNNAVIKENRVAFDVALERNNEVIERNREAVERNLATHADLRTFLQQLTLRNERVLKDVVAGLAEVRADIRANTAAILSMLDRFGPADAT